MSLIGSLGIKKVALDMLKMLVPDLLAEALSLKSLKNLLLAKKADGDGKMDETGDLSKKEAYFQASVVIDAEEGCAGYSIKIARVLNKNLTEGQREKFQIAVGSMAQTEVVFKSPKEITDHRGNKKTIFIEQKVNLGIKFLKSFGKLTEGEMLDVIRGNSDILMPKPKTLGEELKEKLADESSELHKKMQKVTCWLKKKGVTYTPETKFDKFLKFILP